MSETKSRHILCVEDDPATARIIARVLEKAGFVVDLVHDGDQAVAKWLEQAYDAVVLDRTLPGRDGLDVYRDMLKHGPSTPTVMVTATGNEQVAVCAIKMGVGDYLVKDSSGAYLEALPIVVDRTIRQHCSDEEKRRTAEALERSEARFRVLVANIPGIVCRRRVDRDWTLEYASKEMDRITGFAPHEFLENASRSFVEIVHPDDVMRVQETIAQAVSSGKPYTVEYRIVNAAGRICDVVEKGQTASGDVQGVAYVDSVLFDITERRQLEASLREPEAVLRDLYDVSPEAIFVLRSSGISYANVSALRMFGYAVPTDIVGLPLTALTPPQQGDGNDSNAVFLGNEETARSKKSHAFPWLGLRRDGTLFPCTITLTLIGKQPAEVFQCVVHDLTERCRHEERIRLDEARSATLLALIQMTSASYQEVIDYALNEAVRLTGGTIGFFCDVDDDAMVLRAWSKEVMSLCAVPNPVFRFAVKDLALLGEPVRQRRAIVVNDYADYPGSKHALPFGHIPIMRLLAIPVFEGNQVVAIAVTANKSEPYDVSDVRQLTLLMQSMWRHLRHKAVEEELREYRADLELMVHQRTEEVVAIHRQLGDANVALHDRVRELQCLLELSQAAGNVELTLPEVLQCITQIVPRGFVRADAARARIVVDGKIYETPGFVEGLWKLAAPIMNRNGYVGAIEVCYTDDTASGNSPFLPEENRMLQAIAEHLGVICGRYQLEAELSQAQKLESIGRLAAGIAHEINTPTQYIGDNMKFLEDAFGEICGIIGNASRLLEDAKTSGGDSMSVREAEQLLQAVETNGLLQEIPKAFHASRDGVSRVASIVRAMKEFARPAGSQHQALDLNRAIENALTVSRNEWKLAADVETDLEAGLPPICCLPAELNQALLNVIVNAGHAVTEAVDSGRYARGAILVSTRRDGNWVEIRIRDNGPGIRPEHQCHVFEPFFTTKEVGRGSGQGLTLVYHAIVGKHKGTIHFETEVGVGTTFIIRLPIDGTSRSEEAAHAGKLAGGVAG